MSEGILKKGIFFSVLVLLCAVNAYSSEPSFEELIQDSSKYECSMSQFEKSFDIADQGLMPSAQSLIPEPSTVACIGLGVFAIICKRRRRRG